MPVSPNTEPLTPLELEIMRVLWRVGPARVEEVRTGLRRKPELAYTTVQTVLTILFRKGKVRRRRAGRAFVYVAIADQRTAIQRALGDLINRLFGGSAEDLVLTLIQTRHLTATSLARIQNQLDENNEERGNR